MKLKKLFEDIAAPFIDKKDEPVDDHEATMAIADLKQLANQAAELAQTIQPNTELEGWVQSKITKASDYIQAVYKYYHYNPETGTGDGCTSCGDNMNNVVSEGKSTCCGKCGRYHVKGTSCPKPFLTGKKHCRNRPK